MYIIICKNQVEGFHKWDEAPERLNFLKQRHRHIFEITTKIEVNHSNRDLEIIETQDRITNFLLNRYHNEGKIEFGSMSCEQIAKEIADEFNALEVEVLEDGYGGAIYRRS